MFENSVSRHLPIWLVPATDNDQAAPQERRHPGRLTIELLKEALSGFQGSWLAVPLAHQYFSDTTIRDVLQRVSKPDSDHST